MFSCSLAASIDSLVAFLLHVLEATVAQWKERESALEMHSGSSSPASASNPSTFLCFPW